MIEHGFNSGWRKYSNPEFIWSQTVGRTKRIFINSDKVEEEYENDMLYDIKYDRLYDFDLNESRDQLVLSRELSDNLMPINIFKHVLLCNSHEPE